MEGKRTRDQPAIDDTDPHTHPAVIHRRMSIVGTAVVTGAALAAASIHLSLARDAVTGSTAAVVERQAMLTQRAALHATALGDHELDALDRARHEEALQVTVQRLTADVAVLREGDEEQGLAPLPPSMLATAGAPDGLLDQTVAYAETAGTLRAASAAHGLVDRPRECAAVRRGRTSVFPESDALDACPHLAGLEQTSAACIPVSFMGKALGVLHTRGI